MVAVTHIGEELYVDGLTKGIFDITFSNNNSNNGKELDVETLSLTKDIIFDITHYKGYFFRFFKLLCTCLKVCD